jgi:hypothetical protein
MKRNNHNLDEYIITFGKHKGKKLKDVPDEYLYYLSQGSIYGPIKTYIDDNYDAIVANVNRNRYYNKVE